MAEFEGIPQPLADLVDEFALLERDERFEYLIEYADGFEEVPERIATRPFDEDHRVKKCESQAYVWAEPRDDGTLKFHFAVENPQGISAKSFCRILDETISGQPLEEVVRIPGDVVFSLYGRDLSMGKGQGLTGILESCAAFAREELGRQAAKAAAGRE